MCVLAAGIAAQSQPYRHTDDIKKEWQDYTAFQKQELLSFCDFLSEEGFHDRALLAYFQFLYRYPGDPLEPPFITGSDKVMKTPLTQG